MDRTEMVARIAALHAAAQDARWDEVDATIMELAEVPSQQVTERIRKMATDLRQEMRQLQLDNRLARAAAEIPDACARLDAVMELTEEAATKTLDLVEDSRGHVMQLQRLSDGEGHSPSWVEVAKLAEALRGNLSALSEAQAYQDLSGQIIRRVMGLVSNMNAALNELLMLAGIEPAQLEEPDPSELMGPAAGRTSGPPAASQDDADALLADLGI